jgi:L-arabinose isomerase
MWKAEPNLEVGIECWILAGGAHHTVLSYDVDAEVLRDWARIMGIEFMHINKNSTPEKLELDLNLSDMVWKNA